MTYLYPLLCCFGLLIIGQTAQAQFSWPSAEQTTVTMTGITRTPVPPTPIPYPKPVEPPAQDACYIGDPNIPRPSGKKKRTKQPTWRDYYRVIRTDKFKPLGILLSSQTVH